MLDLILIIHAYKDSTLWKKWTELIAGNKTKDALLVAASGLLFIRICLWIFQGLLVAPLSQQVEGYINLLNPVLDLMGCVSFEVTIIIFFSNLRGNLEYIKNVQKFILSMLVVFFLLGILAAIISTTGLGIVSGYKGDWQRGLPAVALLEWQILLACVFCLVMLIAETKWKLSEIPRVELWICIVIWLGASAIWLSQPVVPSASALKPREPNFQIYPFIDSQIYDELAQSILIGEGFGADRIPVRPLYIVFLAFLHLLVGQDYGMMIAAQSLVFALFPVLLYLFGREFFGRPVGLAVALLAILRDYVSNFVSPYTGNLSYSKVYLSEIPTAMLLILFLFIGIHWIRSGFPSFKAFWMGGILGMAMLIRTQSAVVLPVIVLFAFLALKGNVKSFIKSMLFLLVSLTLIVGPWIWRNWNLTGELIFDSPESQMINLALRYGRLNGEEPDVLHSPNESSAEYNQRLLKMAKDAISADPWKAVWGISNSFLNHAVNNILLFPIRNEIKNYDDLYIPSTAFWERWEGRPTIPQSILLIFYIFLFGIGVTAAWQRNGWLGLLPLTLNLVYNLWTSLALLSGQRFMVSMDWSIYLYYMIGLFTLIGAFLFALNGRRGMIVDWVKSNPFLLTLPPINSKRRNYLIFGILFLGIGLTLPLSERIFPDKYPPLSTVELIRQLTESPALNQKDVDPACLESLASDGVLSFSRGMAVYPRYYGAGEGEKITDKIGYKPVDKSRLVFDIIANGKIERIIFPMIHSPNFFPHASDVILIYGQNKTPWFILVKKNNDERFYITSSFDRSLCE
ncbi:MAG: hypothetical protein HY863_14080 [Chloroflexi bacterium]|nr:hypothetical protein [Chloroflexota bacterium]